MPTLQTLRTFLCTVFVFGLAVHATLLHAQDVRANGATDDALELLKRMSDAYKATTSYGDDAFVTVSTGNVGDTQQFNVPMQFMAPNHFVVDMGVLAMIGNGTTVTLVDYKQKQAVNGSAGATITIDVKNVAQPKGDWENTVELLNARFSEVTEKELAARTLGSVPRLVVLSLLLEDDPAAFLQQRASKIWIEQLGEAPNGAAKVLRMDLDKEMALRIHVDEDALVRKMEYVFTNDSPFADLMISWQVHEIIRDDERVKGKIAQEIAQVDQLRFEPVDLQKGGPAVGAVQIVPTPPGESMLESVRKWLRAIVGK